MIISKKYLFIFSLSSLILPLTLSYFPVNDLPLESLKLANDPKIEEPKFDWKSFFSDSIFYKDAHGTDTFRLNSLDFKDEFISNHFNNIEQYSNQKFGFRPYYVKLRNQIDYSLFGKAYAQSVIKGKSEYLYEEQYIKSYYGLDFVGKDSIYTRVSRLKNIQEQLEAQGKLVFVVIAPGKGSYYPEYIPDEYGKKVGPTNYEVYTKAFKENGINYIDFNDYFIKQKNKTKHVLYPKTGIHWSQYAMYNALDSILGYIEHRKHIDLVDIKIDKNAKPTQDIRFKDNDIEQGLNLFSQLSHPDMTYPKFQFLEGEGKVKPSILTISDSFFWQMYDLGICHEVFNDGKFWFYNQTVHPNSEQQGINVMTDQMNLFDELQKKDIIMIMATEANLYKLGFGFIENADNTLKLGIDNYNKKIAEIIAKIKSSPEWLGQIITKANDAGVTLDEQLSLDAAYIYKIEGQNK